VAMLNGRINVATNVRVIAFSTRSWNSDTLTRPRLPRVPSTKGSGVMAAAPIPGRV